MANEDTSHLQSQVHVVAQFQRWDRTKIEFTAAERLSIMATGSIDLDGASIVGYHCIGWIPVFETRDDAEEYQQEMAPNAQVLAVTSRIEEP